MRGVNRLGFAQVSQSGSHIKLRRRGQRSSSQITAKFERARLAVFFRITIDELMAALSH